MDIHQLLLSIYHLLSKYSLCNLFNKFVKIYFLQKDSSIFRMYISSRMKSTVNPKEYWWIESPHYKIHILQYYLTGFFGKILGIDKVSEIVYSFVANICKYWVIMFEQSYNWVPVWSIIGRSFKLLRFFFLVSVNLWVFAVAESRAGWVEVVLVSTTYLENRFVLLASIKSMDDEFQGLW